MSAVLAASGPIIIFPAQVRADPRLEVTGAGDLVITGFQVEDVGEYEVAAVCADYVQNVRNCVECCSVSSTPRTPPPPSGTS